MPARECSIEVMNPAHGTSTVRRPALFVDRDGTLIHEVEYLTSPDQVRLLPGVAAALRRLAILRIPVVVVTNQAGVARGYFPEVRVQEVHAHLDQLLAKEGAAIERYYYCPHHPEVGDAPYRVECACRKPRPGMLLQAAAELHLDLSASCLIGDKISDLQAGTEAGCWTILVRTGYGAAQERKVIASELRLLGVVDALEEAVDLWQPGNR